jgi:hypothetical protein
MYSLTETSLTSMKAAFPTAPTPIHGIPTLSSLIGLMMHVCRFSQTQKTPASATINILFLAALPDLHSYFTNKTYPSSYFPFPKEVDDVPDFSACTFDNERESLKATYAHDQKTQADIVTMNPALFDVFLANLPKAICETYKPIRMKQPNTVCLHMFNWFIAKYGHTTTKDCKKIGREWPPPGIPLKVSSPLQHCSSSALPMPVLHATRWTTVMSLGLVCASSSVVECTPRSTRTGSLART